MHVTQAMRLMWWTLVALALVVLATVEVSSRAGITRPAALLLAQGILPLALLATFIVGAISMAGRKHVHVLASMIIAAVQLSSLAPALGDDPIPSWAAGAPTVTVSMANLRYADPDQAKLDVVAGLDTDVIVLVELTDEFARGLQDRGLFERYRYRVTVPTPGAGGIGVLSTRPLDNGRFGFIADTGTVTATIDVGGKALDLIAVHPFAPMTASTETSWRQLLGHLRDVVRQRTNPLLIIGDFNATRWHAPLRDLLDAGMTDAHEARGLGLSRSWPADGADVGLFGPVMRLDHALVSPDVAVLKVVDVDLRSSDHRGFVVTLAVGP